MKINTEAYQQVVGTVQCNGNDDYLLDHGMA